MMEQDLLEVRVLGDLEVRVRGRRAILPASKKTRALLAYLAITGTPQLREHLCDLLWQGPDDPRGALRWSLTKLRGVLGEKFIQADRERAQFASENARCDATEVRRALAPGVRKVSTEALRDAAARFRGELLEALDLPDCFRWHEWCSGQREAMRAQRVELLAVLVERHSTEPEMALRYARERVVVDPISEAAHVDVVRLLVSLGRNKEAADQADACRRILASELGTKPSTALLAARVRSEGGSSEPPPAMRRVVDTPVLDSVFGAPFVPFVGRNEEMTELGTRWSAAAQNRMGGTVLVAGEPGIGKTRLIDELATSARARGAWVLRGRAFEAEMVRPYGPWIDALRPIATAPEARPFAEKLAPILPELGSTGATTSLDRAGVFDAVAGLLAAASVQRGCIVALDDLQWFDEASLALLHFVARAISSSPILLACTARRDELEESAMAIRLVRALKRDGRLHEIVLGPLDMPSTLAIARAMDAGGDAERVAHESAGNPLFALELARAAGAGAKHTDSLDALMADRLDRLDAGARDLLPWAAALGRGFRVDTLARAASLGDTELLSALEGLEKRGVVRSDATGVGAHYDFVHDLLRAAAYRRLSTPRRRFVHLRIARTLSEQANDDGSLHGDVVHHASLAGEHDLAARAAVSAAERCLRMFAYDEAARLAETGLPHAEQLPSTARIALRLALLQVRVLSGRWLDRASELHGELSRAVLEASNAGMHAEAAKGFHHMSILQRELGDLRGARDSTMLALEFSRASDERTRGQQLAQTARCLALLQRDLVQAQEMMAEATRLLPDHEGDFDCCWANALLRCYRDLPDGVASLERALTLARRAEDSFGECECLIHLVQLALDGADPARALAWCRQLGPVAARMRGGSDAAVADALEALAVAASSVPGSDAHLERAIGRLGEIDAKGMLAYVLVSAADMDRVAGRLEQAQRRSEAALAAAEAVQQRSLIASARASLAELALLRRDRAGAARELRCVDEDLVRPLALSTRVKNRVQELKARVSRRS
jgi:DNA-binding SARP family transcriptional activator